MRREFTKIISPEGIDRLRLRISVEKGKVVNIMVQYEALIENTWHEIVRYDCSHGFLHRDLIYPKTVEKQPLKIGNLKDALQYAEQDIKDRWKWYKERYKRRLRYEKK
jgi:hypothetical protein